MKHNPKIGNSVRVKQGVPGETGPVQKRAFLVTMSGEPYQPARVHYNLFEKGRATDTFAKLHG